MNSFVESQYLSGDESMVSKCVDTAVKAEWENRQYKKIINKIKDG